MLCGRCDVSGVGSLKAALSGGVAFRLLRGPVGDLPALHHGPPVSLHVVDERHDDGRAQQQLETQGGGINHSTGLHVHACALRS